LLRRHELASDQRRARYQLIPLADGKNPLPFLRAAKSPPACDPADIGRLGSAAGESAGHRTRKKARKPSAGIRAIAPFRYLAILAAGTVTLITGAHSKL
jgi:hypothetical protein